MDLINTHIALHAKQATVQMSSESYCTETGVLALSYADDLTLVAGSHDQAQHVLDIACEIFAFIGIKINPNKTVYARSPAACKKDRSELLTLSYLLQNDAEIVEGKVIPPEAIIAPEKEIQVPGNAYEIHFSCQ
jgi:hypothetical protein